MYYNKMLNKKFFTKLREDYKRSDSERRQIISISNGILHDSKRSIFALQRGETKEAEENFAAIEASLQKMEKSFGFNRNEDEGSYKAAVEEYTEAKMFYYYLSGKKLDKIPEVKLDYDSYVGGICDFTGELVRYATNQAAAGNFEKVAEVKEAIEMVAGELTDFDLGGYLRTKYDQCRNNLRKIEEMAYEVKLKTGK
jgi:predicted translin family RNA/ssDNA-binding protein